jgi:hypothetical protein
MTQGRDRVFFHLAIPEKLGLFAAYRWLCSSRGETEFFSPTNQKNSVSSLLIDGFVLPGERASFFHHLYLKNSVSSLFDGGAVLSGERPSFFHHAIPEKLGLFAV